MTKVFLQCACGAVREIAAEGVTEKTTFTCAACTAPVPEVQESEDKPPQNKSEPSKPRRKATESKKAKPLETIRAGLDEMGK